MTYIHFIKGPFSKEGLDVRFAIQSSGCTILYVWVSELCAYFQVGFQIRNSQVASLL